MSFSRSLLFAIAGAAIVLAQLWLVEVIPSIRKFTEIVYVELGAMLMWLCMKASSRYRFREHRAAPAA